MDIAIIPTSPERIESFRRALDVVARERKYLALLEAPPLTQVREFVMDFIQKGGLQFVAAVEDEVVGWCDIQRHGFPSRAHRGTLGMGIVPAYRGRGLGLRLIKRPWRRRGPPASSASNSMCTPTMHGRSRSTKRSASSGKAWLATPYSSMANIATPSIWPSSIARMRRRQTRASHSDEVAKIEISAAAQAVADSAAKPNRRLSHVAIAPTKGGPVSSPA